MMQTAMTRRKYLEVQAGDRNVGVPLSEIRKIESGSRIQAVDMAHEELSGLLHLEGGTVPVLDLEGVLKGSRKQVDPSLYPAGSCVLVIEVAGLRIGYAIHRLGSLHVSDDEHIQKIPIFDQQDQVQSGSRSVLSNEALEITPLSLLLSESRLKGLESACQALDKIGDIGRNLKDGPPREAEEVPPAIQALVGTYLLFQTRSMLCGLPIAEVNEIRESIPLTSLPFSDKQMAGLLPLRGTAIPVIDLATHFGLRGEDPEGQRAIILVPDQDGETGLLVDEILGLTRLAPADLSTKTGNTGDIHNKLILGYAQHERGQAVLLDLPALLHDTEVPLLKATEEFLTGCKQGAGALDHQEVDE